MIIECIHLDGHQLCSYISEKISYRIFAWVVKQIRRLWVVSVFDFVINGSANCLRLSFAFNSSVNTFVLNKRTSHIS
jgi:hypothetical protein